MRGKKSRKFPSLPREKVEGKYFLSLGKKSKFFKNFPHREKVDKYRDFPEGRKPYYINNIKSVSLPVGQWGKEGGLKRCPPSSLPLPLTKSF